MTGDEINTVAKLIKRMAVQLEQERSAHKTDLAEMRASFVARTGADEKLIEGYRKEIIRLNSANDRLNDLLRAERLGRRAEVAALQERLRTPKHPVKVGEWVECTLTDACDQRHPLYRIGTKGRVGSIVERPNHIWEYHVTLGGSNQVWWESSYCILCDPPEADHDTEAGKASAEAALKTEPVADEIKVGDVVEVVSHTGHNTWPADVGSVGTVVTVEEINDSISVHLENIPGKKNALAGYVSFCDVRKVTT